MAVTEGNKTLVGCPELEADGINVKAAPEGAFAPVLPVVAMPPFSATFEGVLGADSVGVDVVDPLSGVAGAASVLLDLVGDVIVPAPLGFV